MLSAAFVIGTLRVKLSTVKTATISLEDIYAEITIITLNVGTDGPWQTVQTQIRCHRMCIWSGTLLLATHLAVFPDTSPGSKLDLFKSLTLVLLNKLRCHVHF